jgi:hypothetical protein
MMLWSWALWGFVGTIVLSTLAAACQGLGLTRINLPLILGTMVTPNRDRAKAIGLGIHLVNGWIFSLLYIATFHVLGRATWWIGGAIGLLHSLFILTVVMRLLPGIHPRMASEHHGPTVARQLEPPGFLALNYGVGTPLAIVVAHILFGMVLGGFYRPV